MLISRDELAHIINNLASNDFEVPVSGYCLQAIAEAAEGSFAFEDAFIAISEPLTTSEAITASQEMHRLGVQATPEAIATLWLKIVTWRIERATDLAGKLQA